MSNLCIHVGYQNDAQMVEIDGVGAEEGYVPWLGQPFGTPYPDPPPEPPTRNRFGVLSILRHEGQAVEYEEVSIA